MTGPNTASTGQVRAFAHTFGILAPTANSESGGFSRQWLSSLSRHPALAGTDTYVVLVLEFSVGFKTNLLETDYAESHGFFFKTPR
jgi:hypothetical protein